MDRSDLTGFILSGGMGRRMGGVDKGLVSFRGQPMVQHVIARLRPQVGRIMLNANQHPDIYASFGFPVVADNTDGIEPFAGPLAGLLAGLKACATPLLLTAPCDSPFLPLDLAERLYRALESNAADIAIASDGARVHPVFMLCRRTLLASLAAYLASGQRKMQPWYAAHTSVEVVFPEAAAFANLNTPEELARLESGGPPSVETTS